MIDAKNQADEANASKSRFIQGLSYRLRTPLNTLIGFSQMMVAEQFGPVGAPRYQEYVADINRTAKQMLETLNDVTDLAQLETTGRIELDEKDVATGTIINEACQGFANAAADGLRFATTISPKVPMLRADERRLRQVLTVLIRYAARATAIGGEIRVAADLVDDGILILIAGSGGGDTDGVGEETYLPHWQGSGQTTGEQSAADLGMTLVRALIQQHEGTLETERDDDGGGVVYRVLLPRARMRSVS